MVVCNLAAQQVPFNAIFLISDPMQKWRLLANFVLYFLPFLAGALYLGVVFLKAQKSFQPRLLRRPRGLGPVRAFRAARHVFLPARRSHHGAAAAVAGGRRAVVRRRSATGAASPPSSASRVLAAAVHYVAPPALGIPKLAVSDYKGVSYARKFPDAQRIYERASPFGYLEVYSSSYLHFAPGQSDNAAFNLPEHAGQRLSRPLHRFGGAVGHHQGPAGRARRPISSTCRCTTRTS